MYLFLLHNHLNILIALMPAYKRLAFFEGNEVARRKISAGKSIKERKKKTVYIRKPFEIYLMYILERI